MKRMKTFLIYLLIFVGLYVISNFLIDAYIKTSYYNIEKYDIDVPNANITILSAKASKDDGHIEGKIVNNTNEKIENQYMKVELFSDNGTNIGTQYIKIESLIPEQLKTFRIDFTCDYVKSFKISLISEDQKNAETTEQDQENNSIIKVDNNVKNITDQLKPNV